EAEASKVSIFAIADYAWNTEDFDDQQSWKDSMKYIEPDATEAFHTLAKHMAHADPEDGLEADESEDIKDLLNETINNLNNDKTIEEDDSENIKDLHNKTINHLDNDETIEDVSPELIKELQHIVDASDEFMEKAKNDNLKKELEPFVNALHDMVLADIEYLEAQQA